MKVNLAVSGALLQCGGACLLLALPGQALAQDPGSSLNSAGDDALSHEIVVTAQRRSERLLDVPATVTVLNADTIKGASIVNTFELAQLTPGLQIGNTGVFTSFALRGVSSETSGPGSENNVAVYVDGAYYFSKNSGVFDFPDVESIEVLKGPQGTLYGRNATGGAILFKTADPTFEPSAKLNLSYGRFNEHEAKAIVSGGIIPDVLAASVSGFYKNDDGYLRSSITGKRFGGVKSALVRGKLMFTPSSNTKFVLSGYYSDRRDRDVMSFTMLNGNTDGLLFDPNAITSTYGYSAANNLNLLINKTLGINFRADIEADIGTITAIMAYSDMDNTVYVDGDNSSATGIDYFVIFPQKNYSQEVYFASRDFGSFNFIAGMNYVHDKGFFKPTRVFAGGFPILDIYSKAITSAFAAYADGNLAITDRLHLSAGLRWTTEKKKHFGAFDDPTFPFVGKKRWNNLSPRATLRYELSDAANVYASYSRGFKSGQFNPNAFFAPESVRPEIVDAFEGGVKARIGDQLSISVAGFYYDYKDIQVSTFTNATQVLQNAAKAEIYGIDAELTYEPMSDLTVRASVSPLHAKYTNFPEAVVLVPTPAAFCPGVPFCGNMNASADLTGNWLPRAPKMTATGSVNYKIRTGNQSVNFFANVYYSGKFYWEIGNRIAQDDYAVVNGRISWAVDNGPLSVELWGKNLTGTKYYVSQGIGFDGDGLLSARPRTWGVALSASF